jgi:hypothetical protein
MPSGVLFLAAAAAAGSVGLAANSTPYSDGAPPNRYKRDQTVTLEFRSQAGIDQGCQSLFGKPPAGMKTNACFTGQKVIMPNPCDYPETETYAHMLCHELGHANGWPSTHGD